VEDPVSYTQRFLENLRMNCSDSQNNDIRQTIMPLSYFNLLGDLWLCIGPTGGLSADGKISHQIRKRKLQSFHW